MPLPLDGPTPLADPAIKQRRICVEAYLRLRGFAAP